MEKDVHPEIREFDHALLGGEDVGPLDVTVDDTWEKSGVSNR